MFEPPKYRLFQKPLARFNCCSTLYSPFCVRPGRNLNTEDRFSSNGAQITSLSFEQLFLALPFCLNFNFKISVSENLGKLLEGLWHSCCTVFP